MSKLRKKVLIGIFVTGIVAVGAFFGGRYIASADNMQVKVGKMKVSIPEDTLAANVTSFLNVRYQPSAFSAVIGEMKPGDTVKYLGTTGEWTKVDVNGQVGYVFSKYALRGSSLKKYIKKNLDKFTVSAVQTGNSFQGVYTSKKAARADAATYTMDGDISSTAVFYATRSTADTIKNEYETVQRAVVKVDGLRFRTKASTSCKIYQLLDKGTQLEILSTKNVDWVKVRCGGKTGYVSADYVALEDIKVNKSNILKTLKKKKEVEVLEVTKNWVKITCDNQEGYVKRKNCDVTAQKSSDKTVAGFLENNVSCVVNSVQKDVALITLADGSQGYILAEKLKAKIKIAGVEINQAVVEAEQKKVTESLQFNGKVSKTRKKLVKYAVSFVGNPYVWGGESLTNGVDCSGFTKEIFKKYGVQLYRCSYEQVKNGKEVSFSKLKPGDLVFYYKEKLGRIGHVAIYIGDGKIVHAQSEKTGITISAWNYQQPYKAVDVLSSYAE